MYCNQPMITRSVLCTTFLLHGRFNTVYGLDRNITIQMRLIECAGLLAYFFSVVKAFLGHYPQRSRCRANVIEYFTAIFPVTNLQSQINGNVVTSFREINRRMFMAR